MPMITQTLDCVVWWHMGPARPLFSSFWCVVCVLQEGVGGMGCTPISGSAPGPHGQSTEHVVSAPARGAPLPLPFTP